ncbi:hypothetical protein [Ornithinimicrobium kibberense]
MISPTDTDSCSSPAQPARVRPQSTAPSVIHVRVRIPIATLQA